MPKQIKEVYTDYTGYTTVEYSDDSTRKYSVDDVPTVSTNPLTGGDALIISKGVGIPVSVASTGLVAQRKAEKSAALIAAPLWAAGATVVAGRMYRLSTGAMLLCTVGGTTGGTEPVVADSIISDGATVKFYSTGRTSQIASGKEVPVITSTGNSVVPSGLTHRRFFPTDTKYSTPAGIVEDYASQGVRTALFNSGTSIDVGLGANGKIPSLAYYCFQSDAPKLAIQFNNANSIFFIEVDGVPIEESPTPLASPANAFYIIDWSGRRKMRNYVVRAMGNVPVYGVSATPQDTVVAMDLSRSSALVWFGDSYATQQQIGLGNTASLGGPSASLGQRVGQLLGMDFSILSNIGGTGYSLPTGLPTAPAVIGMTDYPIGRNAGSYVVYASGYNDFVNSQPVANVVAGAQAAWAAGKAKYPNAKHAAIGPWTGSSGPSVAMLALDAALADAASQVGIPYISTKAWVTGTGRLGAVTGVGNSDFYTSTDNTHAGPAGQEFLAVLIARAVESA